MPPTTSQESPGPFKAIPARQLRQHSLTPITSSPDNQYTKDTMNGDAYGSIGGKVRGSGSASPRVISGTIGSKLSLFDSSHPKILERKITEHSQAVSPTNVQTIENIEDELKDDGHIIDPVVHSNAISQEGVSQLQKENSTKFQTAIQALLAEYIPSTLLTPHPHIHNTGTGTTYVPSILEMEVRHAIALAARNVYHAHIQDDKKRAAFDFKYAELRERYFGKGKRIANEMKKLAKIEKGRIVANNGHGNGGVESEGEGDLEGSVVRGDGAGADSGRFEAVANGLSTGIAEK